MLINFVKCDSNTMYIDVSNAHEFNFMCLIFIARTKNAKIV